MAGINSIISGISISSGLSPIGRQTPGSGSSVKPVGPSGQEDVFTRGQWWKNRAQSDFGQGRNGISAYNRIRHHIVDAPLSNSQQPNDPSQSEMGATSAAATDTDQGGSSPTNELDGKSPEQKEQGGTEPKNLQGEELTTKEEQLLKVLQQADQDVRSHEMAHLAAAGGYANGGPSFQYKQGPDGNRYAVGGEVPIDIGRESSPEQTIAKMRIVRRAALAPASPSSQDQRVAAKATVNIGAAIQELRLEDEDGEQNIEGIAGGYGASPDTKDKVDASDVNDSEEGGHIGWQNSSEQRRPTIAVSRYPGSSISGGGQQLGRQGIDLTI